MGKILGSLRVASQEGPSQGCLYVECDLLPSDQRSWGIHERNMFKVKIKLIKRGVQELLIEQFSNKDASLIVSCTDTLTACTKRPAQAPG